MIRKCEHEWRIYGTRIEEEVYPPHTKNSCSIVCTKCGTEQWADGYSWVEERPIPEYSGSWDYFKDIIVTPHKFGQNESTSSEWNPRTKTAYDEARYKWEEKEEQWVKTYPITWMDYFECIRKMI
jgi:hypothetical protein